MSHRPKSKRGGQSGPAKNGRVNWARLRELYVNSDTVTQAVLAEQEGLALVTVAKKAASEGWLELRRERQDEDAREMARELRRELRAELKDRTKRHLQIIQTAMGHNLRQLTQGKPVLDQNGQQQVDAVTGQPLFMPLRGGSLESVSKTLADLIKMERLILGEVTDRQEDVTDDQENARPLNIVIQEYRGPKNGSDPTGADDDDEYRED